MASARGGDILRLGFPKTHSLERWNQFTRTKAVSLMSITRR